MEKSERVKYNLKLMGSRAEINDFLLFFNQRDKYGITKVALAHMIRLTEGIGREGSTIFLNGGRAKDQFRGELR